MTQSVQHRAETFSCPGCGGRPLWDPESGRLKCPFCGTMSDVAQDHTAPDEYDIGAAPDSVPAAWGEEKRVVRCQGCGAQTILGPAETATACAFCGSPHVLEDQSEAGIAPESVLPFRVSEKAAVSAFRSWLKGKLFAPGKAKKLAQLGKITGVYLPHWTYDSDTASAYTGKAGHYYYVDVPVTVERNGKRVTEMRRERRTRWEPASGHVEHHFNDIVIPGSQRLEEALLETVQPYDLDALCRYQAGFLSGFQAEKPSVDVRAGWDGAQKRIDAAMQQLAYQDILAHADDAQVDGLSSRHSNVRYKLTLLPVYLSSFLYKGKPYHVLVNGQNGRCGGQAPVSALRVLAAIALIIALLVGGYYLMEYTGMLS